MVPAQVTLVGSRPRPHHVVVILVVILANLLLLVSPTVDRSRAAELTATPAPSPSGEGAANPTAAPSAEPAATPTPSEQPTSTLTPQPEPIADPAPVPTATATASPVPSNTPIVGLTLLDGGVAALQDCIPDFGYTHCQAYTVSGTDQAFTVPAGVTSVKVKVWGAGGGGSRAGTAIAAPGGSGGYVEGVLAVSPGTQYTVVVGEGGGADNASVASGTCDSAYGFGGECPPPRTTQPTAHVEGGGGGGLSGLFAGSATVGESDFNRAIFVAGGGGGGEGTNGCGNTSAAGGAGGNSFAGAMPTMRGIDGVLVTAAGNNVNTGGGGGYRGGDGTTRLRAGGTCAGSANGGSNFVATTGVTDPVNLPGSEATTLPEIDNQNPPNTTALQYVASADANVAGVGVGMALAATAALPRTGGPGLVVLLWAAPDFGDGPESYGTPSADNGARHALPDFDPATGTAPLMLGDGIDAELDGLPSSAAEGDDLDGGDDEDGVTTPIVASIATATDVMVSVTNDTDDPATLAGWIDLDDDGSFEAGELQYAAVGANSGTTTVTMTFPAVAATADGTYARFRLFPGDVAEADLSPVGPAAAGEVEDYVVDVSGFEVVKSSDPASGTDLAAGDTVTYTVTVRNLGLVDLVDVDVQDDLTDVLDDATLTSGPVVTPAASGTASVAAGILSFVGDVPAGEEVTIAYTVTVLDPSETGEEGVLINLVTAPDAVNCPEPGVIDPTDQDFDPNCTTSHPVRDLTIAKTSDPAEGTTAGAGESVSYTIVVTNTGGYDYSAADPAEVSDDLSAVLDDAAFNNDADAGGVGTLNYVAPTLSWSGPLAVDGVVTITYSVTVRSADNLGDATLENVVVGRDANCPDPAITDPADPDYDPDCHNRLLVGAVRYEKIVLDGNGIEVDPTNPAPVLPGDTFTYVVTVSNLGAAALTGLTFSDDLTQVLDDATFDGASLTATTGTVSFTAPSVDWSGDLGVGEEATITYDVVVNDPLSGDGTLINGVIGTGPGSNCPPPGPSTALACFTQVPVPEIETVKTSNAGLFAEPGDTVTYTVRVANVGDGAARAFDLTDDLSDVLDDADFDAASLQITSTPVVGSIAFDSVNQRIVWTGPLAQNDGTDGSGLDEVSFTYSVSVRAADELADGTLENTVSSPDCLPELADYETNCVVTDPIRAWTTVKTSDGSGTVEPGQVVTYTIVVENTGGQDLAAAAVASVDDLSAVLDDATYNDDSADGGHPGAFTFTTPTLTWSGGLAVDQVVTLTYSVTVNAAAALGDGRLRNAITGAPSCPDPAITDPSDPNFDADCVVIDDIAAWTVTKNSDAADPLLPGGVVSYTLTVTNSGSVDLPAAEVVVADDLSDVLDDATYNDDATAGATFADPVLSWSGDMAVDQVVTITYSVDVNEADALGDGVLANAVTGGDCPDPAVTDPDAPDFDGDCVVIDEVARSEVGEWVATKVSDADESVRAGDEVTYTITVTNTGAVDLPAADVVVRDDLADVLDDATFDGDVDSGGVGAVTWNDPVVEWSADLAVGQVVEISYTVVVKDADDLGDGVLMNAVTGSPNCPDPAVTDPDATGFDADCVVRGAVLGDLPDTAMGELPGTGELPMAVVGVTLVGLSGVLVARHHRARRRLQGDR